MRHDVYAHPSPRWRALYPFVVQLQADTIEGPERIAAPLIHARRVVALHAREVPIVRIDGEEYGILVRAMRPLPNRALRRPVGSAAAWRDEIALAIDLLFFGF